MMGYTRRDPLPQIKLPTMTEHFQAEMQRIAKADPSLVQPKVNLDPEQEGSADRFKHRLDVFKEQKKSLAKHHFWWAMHNCVAHPLIGLLPFKKSFQFHDWTSKKINGE